LSDGDRVRAAHIPLGSVSTGTPTDAAVLARSFCLESRSKFFSPCLSARSANPPTAVGVGGDKGGGEGEEVRKGGVRG
jgi:hypothetical protein